MGTTWSATGRSTAHPPGWQASAGQGIRWWQIGGAVLGSAALLAAVTGPWVRVLVTASGGDGASVETNRRLLATSALRAWRQGTASRSRAASGLDGNG